MDLSARVTKLIDRVESGRIGRSKPWGGADVVIIETAPEATTGGFYPDPRFVETPHVGELSWLFEKLRDLFQDEIDYGFWKEEFFGRLGNVAEKFHDICPDGSVLSLLQAVLEEAMTMANEIAEHGSLAALLVTSGNLILDDFTNASDSNVYLSQEIVQKRFDLYVGDWAIELDRSGDERSLGDGHD